MYNVNLEVFQGPLDLLLHLIEKMEIDIYNIPIAQLTESYLEYINGSDEFSLENAEEYIVMAATLLHIKSKSLLPVFEEDNTENYEEELVQQLIDYKNYKQLSEQLEQLKIERSLFLEKESESFEAEVSVENLKISPNKLLQAIENILKSKSKEEQTNNITYRQEVSLEEIKMSLDKKLKLEKKVTFSNLVKNYNSRDQLVLVFISILSMIKDNEIVCDCQNNEIYIEYVKE